MTDYKPTDFNAVCVAGYSDSLGSNAPTPGGGSAAGVVLSLAANAAAKAAVFSGIDGSKEVNDFYDNCKEVACRGLAFAHDDEKTFLEWKDARGLPKDTEEQKQFRTKQVNAAVVNCISVPYNLAKTSYDFIKSLVGFIPLCNKWLVSDLLVANSMAYSSFCCAIYNIGINMDYLKDEVLKNKLASYMAAKPDEVKLLYEEIIKKLS